MLAEKGAVHPISMDDLKKHTTKVDEHLELINRGSTERVNLFTLVNDIGGDKRVQAEDVRNTLAALRNGFCLYYEMYATLEDRVRKIDSDVPETEKRLFLGAYSMFAAGSYIHHELLQIIGEEEAFPVRLQENYFNFELTKDETLNGALARYYGVLSIGKRNSQIKEAKDLPKASVNFFKAMRDEAVAKKQLFHQQLTQLVEGTEFKVGDTFTISGYATSYEEQVTATKIEFTPLHPHQIAGNVLAKREMLKDMDRIALFDPATRKNPILEVGGLSWSVLYDGPPGTGKSSLFKMGLTHLDKRCKQASEFWRRKNRGEVHWKQLVVDQAVKDEYYGKTGRQLLAILNQAKKVDGIYIVTTDDIDLLVTADRNATTGGADKDILNVLMQYADGINTVIRGNTQWWAATNDATSMDAALRQRFLARYEVEGPTEWHDFADITYDKLRRWVEMGIIQIPTGPGYNPYEMRKGQSGYENVAGQSAPMFKDLWSRGNKISFRDVGELCARLKKENPRFTGRAVHAVTEAIKKRINDYDIPEEWYEKPELFFEKPYEGRVTMLKELCRPITGEMITEEFSRYFNSEQRYAQDKFESDVGRRIHQLRVELEAMKCINPKK